MITHASLARLAKVDLSWRWALNRCAGIGTRDRYCVVYGFVIGTRHMLVDGLLLAWWRQRRRVKTSRREGTLF